VEGCYGRSEKLDTAARRGTAIGAGQGLSSKRRERGTDRLYGEWGAGEIWASTHEQTHTQCVTGTIKQRNNTSLT
jgi:hypothetical protein